MGVLTINPLAFTGEKSDFVRNARSHGEQKLLAAAKCGDRAAFDELFQPLAKRTFQIVYRITRNREDAEDALQDSFLRAFLHIRAYESRSSFSSWLTSIAVNSALMMLRKKRNSFEISTDGSGNPDAIDRHRDAVDRGPNPEQHCLQKERERILRKAIRALRPSIREVVEMQQLREHSMRETARMIGISAGAKARLFHARIALRKDSGLKTIAKTTPKSKRKLRNVKTNGNAISSGRRQARELLDAVQVKLKITPMVGIESYPCTGTVDNHILRLRQKLERHPSRPVPFLTIHGAAGYKFLPQCL